MLIPKPSGKVIPENRFRLSNLQFIRELLSLSLPLSLLRPNPTSNPFNSYGPGAVPESVPGLRPPFMRRRAKRGGESEGWGMLFSPFRVTPWEAGVQTGEASGRRGKAKDAGQG